MLSVCLRLSTSTNKLPFFLVALVEITFSMRKGENLARQATARDSFTMTLGKSAASFFESDSDRFRLVFFFIWWRYRCCIFFAGTVLYHSLRSPTWVGNWECANGGTHLLWLRWRYTTSILELRVGFRAVAKFRFSTMVKFPILSTQLTLSHRLLVPKR